MRKLLAGWVVLAMLGVPVSSQTPSGDELAKGIGQVEKGEYAAAVVTLDNAIRQLGKDPARARDIANAYLYLGIAHAGTGQEQAARNDFCRAKRQKPDVKVSIANPPANVAKLFAEPCPTAAAAAPAAAPAKKGGSKTLPILLGVGAAAGVAIAVAAGGGDNGPTTSSIGVRRDALFTARPTCAQQVGGACTSAENSHVVMVSSNGVLEATLTTDATKARLFLRAISPSGRPIEAGPAGSTLRIPAEPGRWVLTVWQSGKARDDARYQLRVSFP
ncbi:MAG TPA: hypothetical protein VF310_10360 [Vicinamibacteria bacterium]|jgi:hypothetical protein